jgi:hypothetical protein
MIFLTTTGQDVDEELLHRCMVLTVNEEQEQTRAIHRNQREAQTIERRGEPKVCFTDLYCGTSDCAELDIVDDFSALVGVYLILTLSN